MMADNTIFPRFLLSSMADNFFDERFYVCKFFITGLVLHIIRLELKENKLNKRCESMILKEKWNSLDKNKF